MRHRSRGLTPIFFGVVACVIVFIPTTASAAGAHGAPSDVNMRSLAVCLEVVEHAERASHLAQSGLIDAAIKQTETALGSLDTAIELLPSHAPMHNRHAREHLASTAIEFKAALVSWKHGGVDRGIEEVLRGRDFAEAAIAHAQCKDFLCR